jgi:hypothetical protein
VYRSARSGIISGCTSLSTPSPSASNAPTAQNTGVSPSAAAVEASTKATATPAPTSAGNSGQGSAELTVTAKVAAAPDISYHKPKTGYKWAAFDCSVKNVNAGKRYVSPGWFLLRDTAGGVYEYSSVTFSSEIEGFQGLYTQPGDIVHGLVVFEVPQNVQLKSLTYDDASHFTATFPL